jgi:glycine cleavage system regulatory protein
MDNLKLTTARININLTINKMLLRLQLEKMSDEKRKGIERICNDLEQVRITLSELESENRQLMQENTELLRINLELNSKLAIDKIYEL